MVYWGLFLSRVNVRIESAVVESIIRNLDESFSLILLGT